jgi:hypothetical protein
MISDDLSHWGDIFAWRQHHYQFIVNHYDSHAQQDPVSIIAIVIIDYISHDDYYSYNTYWVLLII